MIDKDKLRDIAERSAKTFIQAFVSALVIADQPLSREVLIAAVAAGLSAAWNYLKHTV